MQLLLVGFSFLLSISKPSYFGLPDTPRTPSGGWPIHTFIPKRLLFFRDSDNPPIWQKQVVTQHQLDRTNNLHFPELTKASLVYKSLYLWK